MFHLTRGTRLLLLTVLTSALLLTGVGITLSLQQTFPLANTTATPVEGIFTYNPPKIVSDFTLPASSGTSLSLSDLRGKLTLLFFGYTHCPDLCPLTLGEWTQVKAALNEDAAQVNFLFISVDGTRDTPAVLRDYLSRFDPDFIGMSGNDATLGQIKEDYHLYYQLHTEQGPDYSVDHTALTYLINRDGGLADAFAYGTPPEAITSAIEKQLS